MTGTDDSTPDFQERDEALVGVLTALEKGGHQLKAADVAAVLAGEQVQPQPRGDAAVVSAGLRDFMRKRGV